MPFGKHRGKPITQVPAGYLMWMLENIADLRPATRAAIEAHLHPPELPLEGREPDEPTPTPAPPPAPSPAPSPSPTPAPSPSPSPAPSSTSTATRRTSRRALASDAPAATCGICGGPGTSGRPLVHAACANDTEVPF